jgi:hypothetical protein
VNDFYRTNVRFVNKDEMLDIKTKDIVDKTGRRIAVRVKAKDFDKMLEVMEDFALVQLMKEDDDKPLSFKEAQKFYKRLQKAD